MVPAVSAASATPASRKAARWSLSDFRPAGGEPRQQKSDDAPSVDFSFDLPASVVPARLGGGKQSLTLAPDTALAHARRRADDAMALRAKNLGLPDPTKKINPTAYDVDVEALIASFAVAA